MSNHYHLLIETPQANLSAAVQWLNVSYATWFNRKHKRQGHLFQGRFKAVLVDADEYLTQVSRNIHLNPVKAKMVEAPLDYAWSSYAFFAGGAAPPEWLDMSMLTHFSGQRKKAISNYRVFVEEADADTLQNPNSQSVAGCVFGGASFVSWVQATLLSGHRNTRDVPQLKRLRPAIAPEKIVETVAATMKSSQAFIVARGRKSNQPRELAIYLALQLCSLSCTELGRYFGGVSGAAISMCSKRFAFKVNNDPSLEGVIEKIKKLILDS